MRFAEVDIITLYDLPGLASGKERARQSTQALERALREAAPSDIKLEFQTDSVNPTVGQVAKIYAGETLVLRFSEVDATHAGRQDFRAYATNTAHKVRDVFRREHQRNAIAKHVLAVSTVVFLGLMALLLLRALRSFAKRARHMVRKKSHVGAVRVGTIELLPPGATREGVRVALIVGSWTMQLLIVYAWIVTSLSLFEGTRLAAERATGTLLAPALALLGRLTGEVPVLVALAFALLIVGLVVRFIAAYFAAIDSGEVEVDWLRPEAARVTGHLLSIGVAIAALLFLAPLLTGTDRGVFSRIGELGLGIIALSTAPILACCALGVRLVYAYPFQRGDKISYGGQVGLVEQVSLFDLVMRAESGVTVRVPHLLSLWHATRVFPRETATGSTVRSGPEQGEAGTP